MGNSYGHERDCSWAILGACLTLSGAASAQAPEPEDVLEEVVVTGTSIRGVRAVGSPIVQVSREDIEATGASNLSQIARTLPVVLNLGLVVRRTLPQTPHESRRSICADLVRSQHCCLSTAAELRRAASCARSPTRA